VRAFVLEPSLGPEGKLKTARKGGGRFRVHIQGIPAHAGLNPDQGASAILELSYVIQELFGLNDLANGVTVNVGTVDGGLRPNVVAPHSTAEVDVRVPTLDDAHRVEKRLRGLRARVPGVTVRVEGGWGRPPLEPNERNQALYELAVSVGAQLGLKVSQGMAGGASDGNTLSQLTAVLDGLGAVGDGAHSHEEYCLPAEMPRRTALLAGLLLAPMS
jgi:glutamate carboxypeptidase